MDIIELILHDHTEQRRMFAHLDDIDHGNTVALAAVWSRLEVLLEVHAAAEEAEFYPHLLRIGTGAGGEESARSEVIDVIKDHNEIRDAVREAGAHPVGTDAWREAVEKARRANGEHMDEEERQDLPDFCHHAPLQLRHDIAVAFATFEAQRAGGFVAQNRDPEGYVAQNS
jgi:hypothetical protein